MIEVINEYLNNFYTEQELASYLGISEEKIHSILHDENLDNKLISRITNHRNIINKWHYQVGDNIHIKTATDKIVIMVADYILETNSSVRETAVHFKKSKTTINDYINEKLPEIDIKTYKKVFDIMHQHKSLSVEYKEHRDIVMDEYKLLMSGYTIEEICTKLNRTYNQVQRDLADRSIFICHKINRDSKKELNEHQLRFNKR